MKIFYVFFIFLLYPLSNIAICSQSTFVKLNFNNNILIEIPKNWTILDKNISDQINNSSEALIRNNGIVINNDDNNILVSANSFSSSGETLSTLRLNLRQGNVPSQTDMLSIYNNKEDVEKITKSSIDIAIKSLYSIEGVNDVKLLNNLLVKSSLVCLFNEFEYSINGKRMVQQSYICPLGDRSIILGTSYNKDKKIIYKPVMDYIWKSIKIL